MYHNPLIAYIDPVSGAIILQVIVAGFVGAVAMFRKSIASAIGRLFGRGPKTKEIAEDSAPYDVKL